MSIATAFFQVAQVHSANLKYESLFMPCSKGLSGFHRRTIHGVDNTNKCCECFQGKVSAVSLTNSQSNMKMILHGEKQRGCRRINSINNSSLSNETTLMTKCRGQPKKSDVDNIAKESDGSTDTHAYPRQKDEQDLAVPIHQTRQGHLFQYSNVIPELSFQQLEDEHELSCAVIKFIAEVSRNSIRSHGWFTVALPGGSLIKVLKALALEPGIEWPKWHVFWVDERVVPLADDDSNFKLAMETFLAKTKIPKEQIHSIDYHENANMVARKYDNLLRSLMKRKVLNVDSSGCFPQFDLIFLGIGPDGHVASLFPNSLGLAEERDWVVAIFRSPKPPAKRISMTLPIINAASHVCFVVVGHGKAEVIQRILERPALPGALPAQMVRPTSGVLHWFVDKEAAKNLSISMWGDPKKFPAQNYSAANVP